MSRNSRIHLHRLVKDPSPPVNPAILVSHPNATSMGVDNPVFIFDEVDNPRLPSKATMRSSVSGSSTLSMADGLPNLFNMSESTISGHVSPRRGTSGGDSLFVPGAGMNPPSRQSSLYSAESVVAPTYNIDALSLPKTPTTLIRSRTPSHSLQSPRARSNSWRSMRSNWSELIRLAKEGSDSEDSVFEAGEEQRASVSGLSEALSERLHELVVAFQSRTERTKEMLAQQATPSSSPGPFSECSNALEDYPPVARRRLDSFIPGSRLSGTSHTEDVHEAHVVCGRCHVTVPRSLYWLTTGIDPQSKSYIIWLFLVTLCFVYNVWSIPLRATFPYQTEENLSYWLSMDYACDIIYVIDIICVKTRIKFLRDGLLEGDPKEMRRNYFRKLEFKLDMLSLLPLDLLYFAVGFNSLLRAPRYFKIKTFLEFYNRFDQAAKSPHLIRVAKTMTYMVYLIHVETCGYYAVSVYEGIGSNKWVYNGEGNAYVRCFYLATKTSTSIGNNPTPTNTLEYVFMTVYWLSGVFVFALLIGQIRDIYQASGKVKSDFREQMSTVLNYLQNSGVPKQVQNKVRSWFTFSWESQKTLDENELLRALPNKMMADLAISVHYETLSKVQLFQDCEKQLLFDLVLKLTPVLYLPGDYICKKGEVGTEMYILKQGQVEVVSADGLVLATLSEGSVFGEISLLALAGGNRRTADVRSKGFSNLFILSKEDFNAAMSDYPKAQKILKKKAVKLLHQNAKLQNDQGETEATEIIKEREGTPRLLKTVIQVVQPDSKVAQMLTKPSSKGKGKGKTSGGKDTEKNGQKGLELRPPQTLKTIKTMAHGENGEITLKIKSTVQSENSDNSLKEEDELSTPFASPGSDVKPLLKQESRQESGLTKADSSSDSTDSGLPGTQEMTQDRHHDNLTLTVTDLTALSDQLDTAEQNTSVETTKTLPKRPNTAPVKSVRTTWSNPKSSSDTNITYLPNIPDCGEDTTTKNTITCRVDVHHEKSWSPSICGQVADKGIDNFAFIESFSHSSHLKEAAEAETEF